MATDNISELRKLLVLKTIVETGSFRQAARKLNVTPSAVSQSLASLEKNLGKVMLIREKNSFRVTQECTELLKRAEDAFSALNGVLGNKVEKLAIGRLDLGSYESLAMDILPEMLKRLKQDHPKAKINLITARTSILLQKLRSGELCTALVTETDETKNFSSVTIAEDEFGLFSTAEIKNSDYSWDELKEIGFASLTPGPDGHATYFQRFLKSLGSDFKATVLSDSFEVLKNAARSGAAISILPKRVGLKPSSGLVELIQRPAGHEIELGKHKILIVYLDQCDDREAEYIAEAVRDIYCGINNPE